jgi:hypothetical protein
MGVKRKKVIEKVTPETKPERKVTFAAWFEKAKKKYKLRDYQDYALQVFFEKHGLTEIEDPEKYEELFKKF